MRIAVLRLLLVLSLSAAQLGGIAHSLSHFKNPSRDGLPVGTLHHCVVCDAYNVFDHGISGAVVNSLSPPIYTALPPASDREFFVAQAAPFAIRAPPV